MSGGKNQGKINFRERDRACEGKKSNHNNLRELKFRSAYLDRNWPTRVKRLLPIDEEI